MTTVPLYDLLRSHSALPPMEEHLRDRGRPEGYVEFRRKTDVRNALIAFKNGQSHPLLFVLAALDSTLISSRHALNHLRDLAHDQNSFDHYYQKIKEETPEKFQDARQQHINRLAQETLPFEYQAVPYAPSEHDISWADKLLKSLDSPATKAIDVVEKIAVRITSASNGYRWEGLKKDIREHRTIEAKDSLQHPNDPHIEGDLLQIMAGYKTLDWAKSSSRDQYQTQNSIEVRRATEIIDALEKWKKGGHPLLVISDILAAVVPNLDHRYRDMIDEAESSLQQEKKERRDHAGVDKRIGSKDYYLVSILLEQEKLRRKARDIMRQMNAAVVAYRGPDSNPEFAAAIDAYIEHLVETPQSSFKILDSIALAMFAEDSHELAGIRKNLHKVEEEEEAHRKANRPMGTLKTQTEAEIKQPLTAVFAARARPEQPPEKLTREIHIEPAGAGMIKPFPSGEYDQRWEEEIYGTITARISTYAVTLLPLSPDKTEQLAKRVKQALAEIAEVEPAFEIPFDRMSKPYKRPVKESLYSQSVEVKDGAIKIYTRLDLDDLWNLYYLLEDVIEPSSQIAAAMNFARHTEARGVLLSIGDEEPNFRSERGRQYSNRHFRPEERLGSLEYHQPENYVMGLMTDTFSLYAIGEIGEEQLLHRVIVAADHTLTGKMIDPTGTFPSWKRLTDGSEIESVGNALTTYQEALKDRAREMLRAMASTDTGADDLMGALRKRARDIGEDLRNQMRNEAYDAEVRMHERLMKGWDSGSDLKDIMKKLRKDFKERTGKDFDGLSEEQREEEIPETQTQRTELAHRANLAFYAGDVGPTSDRTWRGTAYVSRSPGSIWVRKEMPATLAPFIVSSPRDMTPVIRAIGIS